MEIVRIATYPVKSCRGVAVEQARVTPAGLAGDRELAFAGADGTVLSQKRVPALARVSARLAGGRLVLRAGGACALDVDPTAVEEEVATLSHLGRELPARRVRDARVEDWLGRAAGVRASLWRLAAAPFHDLRPVHVVAAESLRELGRAVGRDVEAERFRANLVVSGVAPFAEEGWTSLAIGDLVLEARERTGRCRMVGHDPASGAYGAAVPRALARRDPGARAPRFGRYLVPRSAGVVAVGAVAVAGRAGRAPPSHGRARVRRGGVCTDRTGKGGGGVAGDG